MSSVRGVATAAKPATFPLRWRSWPLLDRPLRASLAFCALGGVGVALQWQLGAPQLALIGPLALIVALGEFFLPTVYELNGEGIDRWWLGRRRQIRWEQIAAWEVRRGGIFLWPHRFGASLGRLRGLYLAWGNQRESVQAVFLARLPSRQVR